MSSPTKDNEEISSSMDVVSNGATTEGDKDKEASASDGPRPPAKRPLQAAVIEISDTESDDSDICAVTSYQASADEVKRIRGADYSSSTSSSDYSSDSESPWEDDSVVIEDKIVTKKVVRAQLNPRANRTDDPVLNPNLKTTETIEALSTHWKDRKDYKTEDITLTTEPFPLCLLHNFLSNPEIINNMVDDMNTLDWSRKKMDLYEFHQTADLASLTWQRSIRGIYELLKTDVMSWVSQVTGLSLTHVSASCSLYGPGDHLVVHDDMLADRRVAFILYLAPWTPSHRPANGPLTVDVEHTGWSPHMGGALQLLDMDEKGLPREVTRSVYPSNNMLALFRVGTDSFHQVDEVVSLELPRLSINGWFHGPAPPPADPAAEPPIEPPPPLELKEYGKPTSEVVVLTEWVSAGYMSPRARSALQQHMEAHSELSLHSFLQPQAYTQLVDALDDPACAWERAGPAHARRHGRLAPRALQALPALHPARQALRLLAAPAFLRLLADCTDLQLARCCEPECRKVAAADYTLIPPREHYQDSRLEAILYLRVPPRPISGGSTVYTAPEDAPSSSEPHETGALVTVPPVDNALSLVFCDAGSVGFTKYVSRITMPPDEYFYMIVCSYKE